MAVKSSYMSPSACPGLPCLRARSFKAEKPDLQRLADMSVDAMQAGYDEAIDHSLRGTLRRLDE